MTNAARSSAPFVVRPFGFYTTGTGNPGANTPTGTVFTRAGQVFAGNVRAVVYAAGQDANGDGVPDGIDTDYGFGGVYDTGIDRWFGHDRVEAYVFFQPWRDLAVTAAIASAPPSSAALA